MTSKPIKLTQWLQLNKASFLAHVEYNGAKKWTIVMGNEAGGRFHPPHQISLIADPQTTSSHSDLDSCASAIGYSYLTPEKPTIGLIQTPRADLQLRAENIRAFELAGISLDDLLCIDDIGVPPSKLASSFALVDYNSLLPYWDRPDAKVVGIIDHHDDEGKHTDASPRNITVPLGSCASLVTETFKDAFTPDDKGTTPPQELATLLLSAIYVDTSGLKPHGKAKHIDETAATFLEKFAGYTSLNDPAEGPAFRKATASELVATKHNVARLPTRDLLRRDYKEFTFKTADDVALLVGLSTVPLSTKEWLAREAQNQPGYRKSLEAWALERKLDVVGVLTTYKSANKGHHRRELLILVGGAITEPLLSVGSEIKGNIDTLADALAKGLESQKELELELRELKDEFADIAGPPGEHAHAEQVAGVVLFWRQHNTDATRKIIAPAFRTIIEGINGVKSTLPSKIKL